MVERAFGILKMRWRILSVDQEGTIEQVQQQQKEKLKQFETFILKAAATSKQRFLAVIGLQ